MDRGRFLEWVETVYGAEVQTRCKERMKEDGDADPDEILDAVLHEINAATTPSNIDELYFNTD